MNKNYLLFLLCAGWLTLGLTSCFSLLKADRMVYAGSIGKKVDAVLLILFLKLMLIKVSNKLCIFRSVSIL